MLSGCSTVVARIGVSKKATGPIGGSNVPRRWPRTMVARWETRVRPMERLTAEDQLMLWPDEIWPQHIGALVLLDGSSLLEPGGHLRIEAVRNAVAGRLHLVPRFRQLLYVPPQRLGWAVVGGCSRLDLIDHVSVLRLPAPADEGQLLLTVEQLRGAAWTAHTRYGKCGSSPGLPDNRAAPLLRNAPRDRRWNGGPGHHCDVPRRHR
jgi:Wax ester synthase-like Acyl-CoA acyltransferase domain